MENNDFCLINEFSCLPYQLVRTSKRAKGIETAEELQENMSKHLFWIL